jgi:hypothetical protein
MWDHSLQKGGSVLPKPRSYTPWNRLENAVNGAG